MKLFKKTAMLCMALMLCLAGGALVACGTTGTSESTDNSSSSVDVSDTASDSESEEESSEESSEEESSSETDEDSSSDDGRHSYNVSFVLNNVYGVDCEVVVGDITDREVAKGSKLTQPVVLVQGENLANIGIDGWYTDEAFTEEWNFRKDEVRADITLYAKWSRSYVVNYYFNGEDTPSHVDIMAEGEILETPDIRGNYVKCAYYTDAEYTEAYTFGEALTDNIDIYATSNLYISAEDIVSNFESMAASAAGSTIGTRTLVGEGEDAYAEIDFGYSTLGDPHIRQMGLNVDIAGSQKIKMTFRNLGNASTLKFYYVVYDANGKPIFSKDMNESCTFTYNFTSNEKNMTADSEWLVKEFDFASILHEGYSYWGTAASLVQFRIQSCYTSTSTSDKNVMHIKSIEGIADDTYKYPADYSDSVAGMLVNDDATAVEEAANAQTAVDGWIFPKDNASASVSDNAALYEKTNGLLFATGFNQADAMIELDATGKNIDISDLSTVKFRLRNFGYATSATVLYYNTEGGVARSELKLDTQASTVVEYTQNMAGVEGYEGTLASVVILYNSNGIDNAILLESVQFEPFKAKTIVGINFNDKYLANATNLDGLELTYDAANQATKVLVKEDGASFEKNMSNFAINGYAKLVLDYSLLSAGVDKVTVELTVDGVATAYEYAVVSTESSLEVALTATGALTKVKVSFNGTGNVYLYAIRFALDPAYSVNYADGNLMSKTDGSWKLTSTYDEEMQAMKYTSNNTLNWYFGASKPLTGYGNPSLAGKSKIIVIYQNHSSATYIDVGLGYVAASSAGAETAVAYPGSTGGPVSVSNIESDMGENEWAALEVSLTDYNGLTESNLANYLASSIFLNTPNNQTGHIYFRAVIIV